MTLPRESLPHIAPAALANIVERAPPRLIKKLDGAPEVAGNWVFAGDADALVVTTDGGERVSIATDDGAVKTPDALVCTCLLSPKCFHILAVASYLPVGTGDTSNSRPELPASGAASPTVSVAAIPLELEPERREVARGALAALASILDAGLSAMGALARAELLRSVHAARVYGLHRLASRALAVAESGRALRERSPTFELEQAVDAMGEAALTAHQLARGIASLEVIGVARRAYEAIGAKRLVGIACEPVLTRSGYAGVVTYVADESGTIFTLQDVAPGDAGRTLASYRATVRLGEASLTHGELSRKGLYVQGATASRDHRLGAGARVSAVSGSGATFGEAPLESFFAVPFKAQLERALTAVVGEQAPTLMFLEGVLAGATTGGVLFVVEVAGEGPVLVTLTMPSQDDALACNPNLRLLRGASGTRLRIVGKVARQAGMIELLTIGSVDGSLSLAAESIGKVQVAFDLLGRGQLRGDASQVDLATLARAQQAGSSAASIDPVASIERRVGRMVLGGRRSLTTRASKDIAVESAALGNALLPTARRALEELLASAATSGRSAVTQQRLLDSWLRAYLVTMSVRRTLASAAWGDT